MRENTTNNAAHPPCPQPESRSQFGTRAALRNSCAILPPS
jgi:hypothetical protein